MNITVKTNIRSVIADFDRIAKEMPEAVASALNKTAAQVKTAAAREIRARGYKLKASTVKDGIRIERANRGKLTARVIASGKPIPLIAYGARDVKPRGVSVSVQEGRKVIKDAFIVALPNGHRAVCVRAPGAKAKKVFKNGKTTWSTLPIKQLYGPSLPGVIVNRHIQQAIQRLIEEKFPRILAHEIAWFTKKRGGVA